MFKKLHINIPFLEALEQMPSYARFMKDILSRKKKLKYDETMMLTEECSAILQNKLSHKLKDLGSFTISYIICDIYFNKALCDLDAIINLMPFCLKWTSACYYIRNKMEFPVTDFFMKCPVADVYIQGQQNQLCIVNI